VIPPGTHDGQGRPPGPGASASRYWKLAGGILLAVALLAIFFRGVDRAALMAALRSADPALLAGVVAVTIVVYAARAWRWGYLLAPMGRVPFGQLFSATFVGFMTGLVVPRAGEVVRPFLVARKHTGIPVSAGFATIILERLIDLFTVLVLFSLYLYVLPTPAAQSQGAVMGQLKKGGFLAAVAAVGVLAVLLAFHLRAAQAMRLVDRVLVRLPARLAAPLGHMLRAFSDGLAVLQAPPGHLLVIAGQSLVVWLGIAAGLYLCNCAFGIALPFHTTFLMLGFLTVGVAVPTPGMVGGFHVAYQLALHQGFGVDNGLGAAAAITSHVLTSLPVLLIGLYYLGREGLSMGKVAQMTQQASETPALAAAPALEGRDS
jgi:uncharacterized protein (TIRG00374 family)